MSGPWPGREGLSPDDVLDLLRPLHDLIGVTRLADVTGLDELGIPVAIAVRPLAVTAAVSAAAGATPAAARAAALLAAAALWGAEACVPPPARTAATAAGLGPACLLSALPLPPGCLATRESPLDWVEARPAAGGPAVLVPRDLIRVGPAPRGLWQPGRITGSAAGLAAGMTRQEAVTAALRDLDARDTAAGLARDPALAARIDLRTVPDPWSARAVTGILAAGGGADAVAVPGPPGQARIAVALWLPDTAPLRPFGAAACPDPSQALRSALAAAARDRMAMITAIPAAPGGHPRPAGPFPPGPPSAWDAVAVRMGWGRAAPAAPPGDLAVDLAGPPGVSAVRVLRPGAAW